MNLESRIQAFYDASTPLWLEVWGEHMHHGYYGADGRSQKSHAQAQVDLVHALLNWAEVDTADHILDAGCGVGGSARLLAKHFGANVLGVTLSPVQAEKAKGYTEAAGLHGQVEIRAQDVFSLSQKNTFDLIWSLESAEHMPDKKRLMDLFFHLLKPGGQLIMATWCHRSTPPPLSVSEQRLLEKISKLYHLPAWVAMPTYVDFANQVGFRQVETDDWSAAVSPFWKAVIRSVFQWNSLKGLLQAGWSTIQGAWAMQYMTAGYRKGTIQFDVLKARKP